MTTIIGVDFSGHRTDHNTWVAQGKLTDDGALLLDGAPHPIRRVDLYDLLAGVKPPAVVAMDFPFGVPAAFAAHLCPNTPHIARRDVWRAIYGMSLAQYSGECKSFGKHIKRICDSWYPESMSVLNSRLVPMTYHGITMLHKLDNNHPNRCWIPPLDSDQAPVDRITLLEVMPGSLLRAIRLPHTGYKDSERMDDAKRAACVERRKGIIDKIANKPGVPSLPNLESARLACYADHDCLDAVVAAIGGAMWMKNSASFRHPTDEEKPGAQLEGCIYTPRSI